ncbi:MAG: efflux RND transporter periplasmic adaptor subunit [Gammaproteobacteria bacterium]|jgi:membrane fusion protein (multidrug efflux system)|nr:efflux RND transporter periplasmic adaptor subunit [Gammaproteobacteria bacterium]
MELDQTGIKAPISGVVTERLIKTGNLVTEHQAVFRIDDIKPLLAVLHVPEQALHILHAG